MFNKIKKLIFVFSFVCIFLFACKNNNEKVPLGAEKIDYDKVEGINKNAPIPESVHKENTPPFSDKMPVVEEGPKMTQVPSEVALPTAEIDVEPDYGGIPETIPRNRD